MLNNMFPCRDTHMHAGTHARRNAHTHTHTHTRARTYTHAHTHTHARAHAHTHTHKHAHTYTHARARTHIHARTHAHTLHQWQTKMTVTGSGSHVTVESANGSWKKPPLGRLARALSVPTSSQTATAATVHVLRRTGLQ